MSQGTARDFGVTDMLLVMRGAIDHYNIESMKPLISGLETRMFGRIPTPTEAEEFKSSLEALAAEFVKRGFPDPLAVTYEGPRVAGATAFNAYVEGDYTAAARDAATDFAESAGEAVKGIALGASGIILLAVAIGAGFVALYFAKKG